MYFKLWLVHLSIHSPTSCYLLSLSHCLAGRATCCSHRQTTRYRKLKRELRVILVDRDPESRDMGADDHNAFILCISNETISDNFEVNKTCKRYPILSFPGERPDTNELCNNTKRNVNSTRNSQSPPTLTACFSSHLLVHQRSHYPIVFPSNIRCAFVSTSPHPIVIS